MRVDVLTGCPASPRSPINPRGPPTPSGPASPASPGAPYKHMTITLIHTFPAL